MDRGDYLPHYNLENQNIRFKINRLMNPKVIRNYLDEGKDINDTTNLEISVSS